MSSLSHTKFFVINPELAASSTTAVVENSDPNAAILDWLILQ